MVLSLRSAWSTEQVPEPGLHREPLFENQNKNKNKTKQKNPTHKLLKKKKGDVSLNTSAIPSYVLFVTGECVRAGEDVPALGEGALHQRTGYR